MSIIHYLVGKALSSRPGFAAVQAYAFRTPHKHLVGSDGSLYMGRWHVVDEGTLGGRLLKLFTGYESVRLHWIRRPDHDRHLHNHPFNYRTFVLKGLYSEIVEGQDQEPVEFNRFVYTGQTATGSGSKFHRIDQISQGGVWTLFFMTKNKDAWGFKVDNKFVERGEYFRRRRRHDFL